MRCFVFKSLRKADTYVYLADREGAGLLPPPLQAALGELAFVMELDLPPGRKLAREDADKVRENLAARGFHIQFPPDRNAVLPPAEQGADDSR